MVKSRKTKAKHQDFQKVKLKVGKKLPKGLNETTATFRTRAVVVKNQLKAESSQPVTKRRLNIQELLCQCQHYSSSVKQDALSGLRELLSGNPDLLLQHLPVLLERLAELLVDKEPLVRQAVLRLLKQVFDHITEDQLSPFFPVLSAYLASAMTHIQEDIKRDSLNILDLLLDHYPTLVTVKSNTLLTHFVDQISQQGQRKGGGDATKMLAVNPSSRISTMKWRRGVLRRLYKFLKALLGNTQHSRRREDSKVHVTVDGVTQTYCQPLSGGPKGRKKRFLYRLTAGVQQSEENLLQSPARLREFMATLVPLLVQCWVEVTAGTSSQDNMEITLTRDSISTLESVVEVLQLLLQCVHLQDDSQTTMEWLQQQYLQELRQHFMQHFPFSYDEVTAAPKKARHRRKQQQPKMNANEMSAVTLNLGICDIMTKLTSATLDTSSGLWMARLARYCNNVLQTQKLSPDQVMTALDVARHVLRFASLTDVNSKLLNAIQHTFQMKLHAKKDVAPFLNFLEKIVGQDCYAHLRQKAALERWLEALPTAIGEKAEADKQVVELIRRVISRGSPALSRALQSQFQNIIGEGHTHDKGKHWIDLVYYLPHLDREVFTSLADACLSGRLDTIQVNYLLDVLHQRFEQYYTCQADSDERSVDAEGYISFLLTLIMGRDSCSPVTEEVTCVKCGRVQVSHSISQARLLWEQHQMCMRSCQDMQGILNHKQVTEACQEFVHNIVSSQDVIPLRQAWGCVRLCLALLPHVEAASDDTEDGLVRLCVCLHHIYRALCEQQATCDEADELSTVEKVCDLIMQILVTLLKEHHSAAVRWVSLVTAEVNDWSDRASIDRALDSLLWVLQTPSLQPALHACKQQLLEFQQQAKDTMERSQSKKWAEYVYMVAQL